MLNALEDVQDAIDDGESVDDAINDNKDLNDITKDVVKAIQDASNEVVGQTKDLEDVQD